MELADAANPFVEHSKPWEMKKDPERQEDLKAVCTIAVNLFRQLMVYLAPVLPKLAEQSSDWLNEPITTWEQSKTPLLGTSVGKFSRMLDRVQTEDLEKMIEESKDTNEDSQSETSSFQGQRSTPSG